MLKKKSWAKFQRIVEVFTQKIDTKLSKIWVWDPRSGIQGSKRHRIPDPDPQHWYVHLLIRYDMPVPYSLVCSFLIDFRSNKKKNSKSKFEILNGMEWRKNPSPAITP